MTIPTNPRSFPATSSENSIQKADIPKESPKIFGPIRLPSICWMINMITKNHRAFIGDTNRIIKKEGTAPIKGPKNGITLVTPTMKDTKMV